MEIISLIVMISVIIFTFSFFFIRPSSFGNSYSFDFTFAFVHACIDLVIIGIGVLLFSIGFNGVRKANSDLERVMVLSQRGILIKNIPYEIVLSNVYINGNPICCLKIIYKSATGTEIPLISDQKFNGIYPDKDGTCDLLIDSNDYSNYFIDFEII